MNTRLVSGSTGEGKDHNYFIVSRPNRHAHAVVLAALVLAHQCVRLWIKEIRVGIERMQHPWNGPVINSLIRVDRLRVVILDDGINVSELLQAILDVGIA